MANVSINKQTKWECQQCGKCCNGLIISKQKSLSIIDDGCFVCKHFDKKTKLCNIHDDTRPFICRIYPFIPNIESILSTDGIAYPRRAFALENIKIHTECCGYGRGQRVFVNKQLHKTINKLSLEFSENFRLAHQKKIALEDIY
ncbi:MAG: YkgJ family cysteine cluster protein [Candidatus Woesearchaeota archaeon]